MALFRLLSPLACRRAAPFLVCLWLVSLVNWNSPGACQYDRVLEFVLVLCGIHFGHCARTDCPRPVLEYLTTLPMPRARALCAPARAAAIILALVAVLTFVHEVTGLAGTELRLLGIEPTHPPRAFHPWFNLLGFPLAAFWLQGFLLRAWTARSPALLLGSVLSGTVITLTSVGLLTAIQHLGEDPWRQSLPGLAMLAVATIAMVLHDRMAAATPLDDLPATELPWTS